jgi:2-desacetyl-2-hydroxyethyl bacteriochlorophyllide A dehydrogenase
MRAARFFGVGKPLEIVEVPVPEPGPDEVLVKVAACGVCASDVHMMDGTLPVATPPPVIPGHETSGTISVLGANVTGRAVGDRVVLYAGKRCGRCRPCLSGRRDEECLTPLTLGVDYDGAWAEYVAVPAAACAPLPDEIPFDIGAILADCVATPFGAVFETGALRAGERAAIFGAGGLGTHAIMLARLGGASFIAAVDPLPSARERATRLGADLALDPYGAVAAIKTATDGEGVDVAFDFAGIPAATKGAVASLAKNGRAVIVGVSGEPIKLGPAILFAYMHTKLLGHYGYSMRHLEQLTRLVSAGRLDLSGSITKRMPLEDAAEAVDMLATKRGDPVRLVLIP